MNTELKTIIKINDVFKREQIMRSKLESVRHHLSQLAQDIQISENIKYTGWNVLLKKNAEKWECVGIVNPDKNDEIPEEFDMVLPIPDQQTLPEFTGW